MRSAALQCAIGILFCCAGALSTGGAAAFDPNPPTLHSKQGAWPIRRQWTPAETQHYARWVEHVYLLKTQGTPEQQLADIVQILTDPDMNMLLHADFLGEGGNPQLPRDIIEGANDVLDCGKFTAIMPAYYAYRRALPWMAAYVRSASGGDVRTAGANIPVGAENSFTSPSLKSFFQNAINGFSSGNYRVDLYSENADQSDTVPVAINRQYLLPGCVNYLDGHCLLLAQADPYGELHFLNASTTRGRDIYTYNGMNTVLGVVPEDTGQSIAADWHGVFQGLRVFRYPIAETDGKGRVVNVRRRTNDEMREFGFSTEQFTLLQAMAEQGFISEDGVKIGKYHDFIRMRMKTASRIPILEFMTRSADDLLAIYKIREGFVQLAWKDVRENGPIVYPENQPDDNIFQAHGRWETWSSPSSDVDRRNAYFYLRDWCLFVIRWFNLKPDTFDLSGLEPYKIRSRGDMARALVAEKNRLFGARSMAYMNTNGEPVKLTLLDIEKRLHDLSFDPNHPPELRWGAPEGGAERASAPDMPTPLPDGTNVPMSDAYRWETYYRSVSKRETEPSGLRGMPVEREIRFMFDDMLKDWYPLTDPSEAILKWLGEDAPKTEEPSAPSPPPRILVPRVGALDPGADRVHGRGPLKRPMQSPGE